MTVESNSAESRQPVLERRFGLVHATALNMANMVGIGPFITIPLLMSALGGPQAMLGWLAAILITLPDALVWSELGAAMPGSGGTYHYLREAFGRQKWGRLMGFLFIWQFLLSGPLEIASGYIGFAKYARYVFPGLGPETTPLLAAGVGVLTILLLYRRIVSVARITLFLWTGTLLTTGAVIFTGVTHFDPRLAFDFPPGSFQFSLGFLLGLGAAARIGVYDYLGYYDVCYIGEEVRDPGRVIPRSIVLSLVAVAVLYLGINLSIIGIIPWREFVPVEGSQIADFVVSVMMERAWGPGVSKVFTGMILWTTLGSVFALLLGYSRIPFAAARDGCFFRPFARLHPQGFPALSLLLVGGIAVACSFLSLEMVINALLTTRLLIQFVAQAVAVILLRRTRPAMPRPYRMWLYPLPCLLAIAGWLFLLFTSDGIALALGFGSILAGIAVYFLWAPRSGRAEAGA